MLSFDINCGKERGVGEKKKMGQFVAPRWILVLSWVTALIIVLLNGKLLYDTARDTFWPAPAASQAAPVEASKGMNDQASMTHDQARR